MDALRWYKGHAVCLPTSHTRNRRDDMTRKPSSLSRAPSDSRMMIGAVDVHLVTT